MKAAARKPSALHLVLRPDPAAVAACQAFCRQGDAVVLMDTAVLLACDENWATGFPQGVEFCCLCADAGAHGLLASKPPANLTIIGDDDLVQRVMDFRHCLTWK